MSTLKKCFLLVAGFIFYLQVAQSSVKIMFDQKIQMRDGTKLSAVVYLPEQMNGALPVVLTITPYIADHNQHRGMYFTQHGYAVVTVDSRGRGNSEGEFIPFEKDGQDGYDVIEWITHQNWCNGQVAMVGGSYKGMNQWLTMKYHHTALKTMVPTASAAPGIDFPQWNNLFYPYNAQWIALTAGKTANNKFFSYQKYWNEIYLRLAKGEFSLKELAKQCGINEKVISTWLSHPTLDNYWKNILPAEEDYKKLTIPVLTITGHYDDDQQGAMYYYRNHMKYGTEEAKEKHYLVSGPWDHGGTRRPSNSIGDLKFGENSVIDMNKLHKEWLDWILKNGSKPEFLKGRIVYYEMGSNEWKSAAGLENIYDIKERWYISSNGQATDPFHAGTLSRKPSSGKAPDKFIHNPLDTVPLIEETKSAELVNFSISSNAEVFNKKAKLVYISPPFENDVVINGVPEFSVYASIGAMDADFQVDLYEVKPNGETIFIAKDVMRARYRNSLDKADPVIPGKINRYVFNSFYFFSRKIFKGSRLQLVFSTVNSIHWQKNFGSGREVAGETAKDAVITEVNIYFDEKHPSYLDLPVLGNGKIN